MALLGAALVAVGACVWTSATAATIGVTWRAIDHREAERALSGRPWAAAPEAEFSADRHHGVGSNAGFRWEQFERLAVFHGNVPVAEAAALGGPEVRGAYCLPGPWGIGWGVLGLAFRESADRRVLQLRCEDRGGLATPLVYGVLSMRLETRALRAIVLRSKPLPDPLHADLRGACWQLRLALLLLAGAGALTLLSSIMAFRTGSSAALLDASPYRQRANSEEARERERRRTTRVRRCVAGAATLVACTIGLVAVARGPVRQTAPMHLHAFVAGPSDGSERLSPAPVPDDPEFDPHRWEQCFHDGHDICHGPDGRRSVARARRPTVRARPPTVSGPLSTDAIRRVVLRSLGQVNHCYERGLAEHPDLTGRVVVRFVIGGTGAVVTSNVASSSIPVASVGECIAAAVTRWQFPPHADGGRVTVSYPFDFLVE
jgi:TonB family protein